MKIVVNAGHGKYTPGKRSPDDTLREFHFNNAVANLVKQLLEGYENVEVRFTHDPTGEVDVPLKTRTDYANRWGADLYLSIHANAVGSGWSDAHGIETFVHTSMPKEASELANIIQLHLVDYTKRRDRGVKTADFHELRESHMTAVLVECGFMTNKEECQLLKSNMYQEQCARALVVSIIKKYNLMPKKEVKLMPDVPERLHVLKELGITDLKNPDKPVTQLYVWEVIAAALKAVKEGRV